MTPRSVELFSAIFEFPDDIFCCNNYRIQFTLDPPPLIIIIYIFLYLAWSGACNARGNTGETSGPVQHGGTFGEGGREDSLPGGGAAGVWAHEYPYTGDQTLPPRAQLGTSGKMRFNPLANEFDLCMLIRTYSMFNMYNTFYIDNNHGNGYFCTASSWYTMQQQIHAAQNCKLCSILQYMTTCPWQE